MSTRSKFVRASLLVGVALLGACAMNPMGTHAPTLSARLSGSHEVPPVSSPGSGTMEARYNTHTQVLKWTVSHSGLSGPVTAAHLHGPAVAGQNAGVALPFTGPFTSPFEGEAKLTAAQAADLLAGRWYVNLHTAARPGGEIRGQVTANR